jgi:general secretion pathway protein M
MAGRERRGTAGRQPCTTWAVAVNERGLPLPAPLAGAREQLVERWKALAPRERRGLRVAFVLLSIFIVWLVAVQPAWRAVRAAPAQLEALDLQVQHMQRLAGETRELRAAPTVAPAQAANALRSATEQLGDRARLSLVGDRATLTLTGVTGDRLIAWLAEARTAARARPIDAQLTRSAQGYSGTVVVSIGGTP